jgi:hypothetical protein
VADDTTTAEFILRLKEEMSGSAASAAQALSNLKSELEADQKALADMEKAMRNLKKAASVDEGAMRTLTEAMNTKREAIGRAQAAYVELGGEFGRTKSKGGELIARLKAMESGLAGMPGPLGQVIGSLSKLAQMMGGAGWLALGAGLAAVAASAVIAAKTLFDLGLANADARRNELLHLEALTKMRSWFGFIPGNAKEMIKGIDDISTRVSISREEVSQFNDTLYKSGLRGASLKTALEATAIKASALGTAAGNAFAGMAAHANLMGVSVNRLAQDVKNRFGNVVAKQMKSLEVQSKKQKEAFSALFSDLDVEPLLGALRDVRQLFSQNTEAGKTLKFLFTTLIQPLFDSATKALPFIELFFDGIVEGALDVEIAFLTVRNWWRKTFGPETKATTDDYMSAFETGKNLVEGFAGAIVSVSALMLGRFAFATAGMAVDLIKALVKMTVATWAWVFETVIPAMATAATAIGAVVVEAALIAAPFILAAAAVFGLFKILELFYVIWREIDWVDLGRSMWKGIVDGLTAGLDFIKNAMSKLALGAMSAFKDVLKIHSPSMVFADLGVEIPKGVEQGVAQGTPEAQRAVDDMVTVPKIAPAPAAAGPGAESPLAAAGSASGSGATITIGEIVIHTNSDKPRELATAFRRELESVLEGVALQMGARVAGAP